MFAFSIPDLTKREFTILLVLIIPTIVFGIYPVPILDGIHYSVSTLIYSPYFNVISCDAPRALVLYFHDTARPEMENIIFIWYSVFFTLFIILYLKYSSNISCLVLNILTFLNKKYPNILIIITTGYISRYLINNYLVIDVFVNYNDIISILYYSLFSCFSVYINELEFNWSLAPLLIWEFNPFIKRVLQCNIHDITLDNLINGIKFWMNSVITSKALMTSHWEGVSSNIVDVKKHTAMSITNNSTDQGLIPLANPISIPGPGYNIDPITRSYNIQDPSGVRSTGYRPLIHHPYCYFLGNALEDMLNNNRDPQQWLRNDDLRYLNSYCRYLNPSIPAGTTLTPITQDKINDLQRM